MSPVPVLIVKSRRPYRRPVVLAAVDPSHALPKPGRLDDEILRLGGAVTGAMHGTLHALHACPLPLPVGMPPAAWTSGKMKAEDIRAEIEAEARAQARPAFDRVLKSADIPRSRRHLLARHPIDAIPDVAHKTRSAIVVNGAVSRSGLKSDYRQHGRACAGSTPMRLSWSTPCASRLVCPVPCAVCELPSPQRFRSTGSVQMRW